jgi:antitoxin component YwqK of YwqJK toxin-antitoxin module/uncharacterized RDD family membrane protein YckC
MNERNLSTGHRYGVIAIDLFAFVILTVAMFFIIDRIYYYTPVSSPHDIRKIAFGPWALTQSITLPLFVLKDLLFGKSPAKYFMNIIVVDYRTGAPAKPWQCVLRNATIVIWPLELIALVAMGGRRIGDLLAGTDLAEENGQQEQVNVTATEVFLPIAITLLVSLLIIRPIYLEQQKRYFPQIGFDPASINNGLSAELGLVIKNKMALDVDSGHVFVFQNTSDKGFKLVSLTLSVNNLKLLDDERCYSEFIDSLLVMSSRIEGLEKIVLKGMLKFHTPNSSRYRSFAFDGRHQYYPSSYNGSPNTTTAVEHPNPSTKVLKQHYPNGQLESISTYVNGKIDGTYQDWYPDGTLKTEIEYRLGKREGITRTFYPNGQKESEMEYEDNDFKHYINRWDESGILIIEEE